MRHMDMEQGFSSVLIVPLEIPAEGVSRLKKEKVIDSNDQKYIDSKYYEPHIKKFYLGLDDQDNKKNPDEKGVLRYYNYNLEGVNPSSPMQLTPSEHFSESTFFKRTRSFLVVNQTEFGTASNKQGSVGQKFNLAYAVVLIEWKGFGTVDSLIRGLIDSKILRYHGGNGKKDGQCKFKFVQDKKEAMSFGKAMTGPLETVGAKFRSPKFIGLHMSSHDVNNALIYGLLRQTNMDFSEASDENKVFMDAFWAHVMNEGAIIKDPRYKGSNAVETFNRYGPAFLIALNQREVFKVLIEGIAFHAAKGEEHLMESAEEQLEKLTFSRINQEFYHLSEYTEIKKFFSKLQEVFSIELLVRDVQDSVQALNKFNDIQRNNREVKKNNRMNNFLFAIAVLSVISAIVDGIDLFDFIKNLLSQ